MSSSITQRSILRHLENFNHHIYAAYSEANAPEVRLVLEHLRKNHLKVYDPAEERVPGKRIFYKWLENGIHKSRITLLFWSKEFKQNELCLYQSENAVLRTSLTKGRHIVICVVINNCKIPNLYKQFDCVYAWKWKENPPQALDNVLQSVLAHLYSAKRSHNLGPRASFLVRKRTGNLLCQHKSRQSKSNCFKAMHVLLNFRKIQSVLENCVLCCPNHGCVYRCAGSNIKQFYAHVSACKFAHVQCSNIRCRQSILRGQSLKHKKRCRYKKSKCPNENCREEYTPSEMKKHKELCSHRTKLCPYRKFGCEEHDTSEHLAECDYVMVECDLCKTKMIRMEIEEHKQQRCPHGLISCQHCSAKVKRLKLESHEKKCRMPVTCDNAGCGAKMARGLLQKHKLNCSWETYPCSYPGCGHLAPKDALVKHKLKCEYRQQACEDCGARVALKDINWHKRFCDQMLECSACGFTIPASTKSTHDKWQCSRKNLQTFCRSCHASFGHSHIEEHQRTCTPVAVPEEPRPVLTASKPVTIGRSKSESDHQSVLSPGDSNLDSASSHLQDSGFHSLSTSSNSGHGTPSLTRFERSALWVAIETIPEVSTSRENADGIRSERTGRTRNETQTTDCDFGTWNKRKVNPASRTALNEIYALFDRPQTDRRHQTDREHRFAPTRRKEMTNRGVYCRW